MVFIEINLVIFLKHFQWVYSSFCSETFLLLFDVSTFYILSSYFKQEYSEFHKTAAFVEISGLDGMPSFVIKDCSEMFVPILKLIFLIIQKFLACTPSEVIACLLRNKKVHYCLQKSQPLTPFSFILVMFSTFSHMHCFIIYSVTMDYLPII
jgi:hypothetical protein